MLSHVPSKGGGDVVYSCMYWYVISVHAHCVPHGNIVSILYAIYRDKIRVVQSSLPELWLGYHNPLPQFIELFIYSHYRKRNISFCIYSGTT